MLLVYGLDAGLISTLLVSDVSLFFVVLRRRLVRCGVSIGGENATYFLLMLHDLCLVKHSCFYTAAVAA